jgi:hypothetical protein
MSAFGFGLHIKCVDGLAVFGFWRIGLDDTQVGYFGQGLQHFQPHSEDKDPL